MGEGGERERKLLFFVYHLILSRCTIHLYMLIVRLKDLRERNVLVFFLHFSPFPHSPLFFKP